MVISDFFILLLAVMACSQVVEGKCNDCKIKYRAVGCYKHGYRPLSYGKVSKFYIGRKINWFDWITFMERSVCRCAALAKKHRRSVFGLTFRGSTPSVNGRTFYGECWSLHSYKNLRKVPYNKCNKSPYKPCNKLSKHCIGKPSSMFIYQVVIPDCDIPVVSLGCFADKHQKGARPLPQYYLTDRDRTRKDIYSGKTIDWRNWDVYMPELVCRCAKKAKQLGRTTFGVQFYGECWTTGEKGYLTYNKDGPSKQCIDQCFKPCRPYQKYCAGKQNANFVYRLRAY